MMVKLWDGGMVNGLKRHPVDTMESMFANDPLLTNHCQGLVHQYLCAHRHPHHGGHERVRQEMDGCVAATQEYPGTIPPKIFRHYPSKNIQALSLQKHSGTIPPKIFRHYPPKRSPDPGWLGQSGVWLPAFQMAGI